LIIAAAAEHAARALRAQRKLRQVVRLARRDASGVISGYTGDWRPPNDYLAVLRAPETAASIAVHGLSIRHVLRRAGRRFIGDTTKRCREQTVQAAAFAFAGVFPAYRPIVPAATEQAER